MALTDALADTLPSALLQRGPDGFLAVAEFILADPAFREALTAALAEGLHVAGLGVGCDAAFADGTFNSQGLHLTVHQRQAAAIVVAMLP